jgi:dolichol-phosphate mannosyltransferase
VRNSKNKDISVVIPAYCEEENLAHLLPRLIQTIKLTKLTYEVLVVDTIKPLDKTEALCRRYKIKYLKRKGDNSYGSAIRIGIDEAHGQYILFMDADGSHTPEFIPKLLKFRHEYEIVVASRYVGNGKTENSLSLILMSRILNWTYAYVLSIPCKDVSNSFKIYRTIDIKPLKLKANNFDIVEEIIYKVCQNQPNISIKEVPFSFKKRMYGSTKRNLFIFVLTFIFTMFKLRFGM